MAAAGLVSRMAIRFPLNRGSDWQSRPERSWRLSPGKSARLGTAERHTALACVLLSTAIRVVSCQLFVTEAQDDADRPAEEPGSHPAEPAGGTASLPDSNCIRGCMADNCRDRARSSSGCWGIGICPGDRLSVGYVATPSPRPMRSAGMASFTPVTFAVFSKVFRVLNIAHPPTDGLGRFSRREIDPG
jgi:hypothetical protein